MHTCRRASEDASVEEDVDDAALAVSLQVAAKRTSSAREALEKRRRREARPQRAVDAPQKPTLAMRDGRVKSSMEPQQELRELFDEGSWGALPERELVREREDEGRHALQGRVGHLRRRAAGVGSAKGARLRWCSASHSHVAGLLNPGSVVSAVSMSYEQ